MRAVVVVLLEEIRRQPAMRPAVITGVKRSTGMPIE
jgi:hypothetical protein